jgi:hypothetical protein
MHVLISRPINTSTSEYYAICVTLACHKLKTRRDTTYTNILLIAKNSALHHLETSYLCYGMKNGDDSMDSKLPMSWIIFNP